MKERDVMFYKRKMVNSSDPDLDGTMQAIHNAHTSTNMWYKASIHSPLNVARCNSIK
jgi:hypothetical protein